MARQIIQEQVRSRGDALSWSDRERYCRLMLEGSIASYLKHAASEGTTFFDRGIPDTLRYARMIGSPIESAISAACDRSRYMGRVFLARPWREIHATDTERKQTYDKVVKTYHMMGEAYEDCGYGGSRDSAGSARTESRFCFEYAVESSLYAMTLSP